MVFYKKFIILYLTCLFCSSYAHSREVVRIIGVGDIMLGTNYPSTKYLPPNNGKDLLVRVNSILKQADVTFGNLEGAILNQGESIKTNCNNCYAFRMPEKLAYNLKSAGFDILSVANNHVRDFGELGLRNTFRVLNKLGIKAAGTLRNPSVTFTRNGVTYGFAAFAPNTGTVDIRNIPKAKKIVRQLEQKNDIVIVSFHGGAEGQAHQHVPKKTEYYYGENRGNVYQFAHAVIDAGADIVFGHGPHVTRAVEVYKNRFIAYSLGNFCTYGRFSLKGPKGISPIIQVHVNKAGQFIEAQIIPTRQIAGKGVVRDSANRAISIIKKLTLADGFLHNLRIDSQGKISLLK